MPKQLALRLVPSKAKPATDVEIAQAEFRALKTIRSLSKDERQIRMDEIVELVRPVTIAAGEIVEMTKDQLAEDVKEKRDLFVQMRSDTTRAKDAAKAIVDLISAAEARITVALTNP
jgi:uncharacterized protein YgbK (DUF1537 family)